ncbi:PhoPQ-activated pathogenicity-related family protein [Pirellulaceae bacterium SH449]
MSRVLQRCFAYPALIGLFLVSSASADSPDGAAGNELDQYIAKKDDHYKWELLESSEIQNYQFRVIKLTTQKWRTEKDVDRPIWEHLLVVTIPPVVKSDKAFLLIGGGSHNSKPPKGPDPIVAGIAQATGSIVAELKNVPNQPLVFHNDGQPRTEDDLIGYAWAQFLETGDATWLPRFPMAKSAVRAMDCITEFCATEQGGNHKIEKFVVGGGSKRGWTTWITGAVDKRVEAIVPIVIDVLNVEPSLTHHGRAYGFWAEAIGNYYQHRILQRFDHPRMKDLYTLVDPLSYKDRLTMPKYIVNGSGDQFFLPDSSKFYWDELQGKKLIRYVPNADHSLKNSDAAQSIATFHYLISNSKPLPEYSWSFEADGSIRVNASETPVKVLLWQANNPNARDFRLQAIGPAFQSTELTKQEDGSYVAPAAPEQKGWTATYVELWFGVEGQYPLKVTTAVRVTPDVLPFADMEPKTIRYERELESSSPTK